MNNELILRVGSVIVALTLAPDSLSIGSIEGCPSLPVENARNAADRDPFFTLVAIHRAVVDEINRMPTCHRMHIRRGRTFHSIADGMKTVELRRADGAFQGLREGDSITFTHTSHEVHTTVTKVESAESIAQGIDNWRRAAVPGARNNVEAISYLSEVLSPRSPVLAIHFVSREAAFRDALMHHLRVFANAESVTSEAFHSTRNGSKYALLALLSNKRGRILHSATNCCVGPSSSGGHAERQVLDGYLESGRKLPRSYVRNLTLTVMRFDAAGSLAMAKPCAECCKRIRSAAAHVKRVRWSTGNGEEIACCNSERMEGQPTGWMLRKLEQAGCRAP